MSETVLDSKPATQPRPTICAGGGTPHAVREQVSAFEAVIAPRRSTVAI